MLLPGMRWARPASVTVYSAKPPGAEAMTRSPGLKSLTSLPTASTSPEHSRPMRAPTPPTGPCWMPAATNVSARLRLEARTLIRTSLGFGSGFGRSRTSIPFSPRTAAFTVLPPLSPLAPIDSGAAAKRYRPKCYRLNVLSPNVLSSNVAEFNRRASDHNAISTPCHDERRQLSAADLACPHPAQSTQ